MIAASLAIALLAAAQPSERAADPPPSPVRLWGRCVGGRTLALAERGIAVEAIAEQALGGCRIEEAAARRYLVAEGGPARAEAEIRGIRDNLPALVERALAARRARPD